MRGVVEWYESDKGPDGKRGKQTLVDAIGVGVGDNGGATGLRVRLFRGRLSVDDSMMRDHVGDPYASRKLKLLDSTRNERAAIRAKHRDQQMDQVVMILQTNLEGAWAASHDASARKQALFDLWDEIAEPDPIDDRAVLATRRAREEVVAFIRARLPQVGRDAYTADEIAVLNARKQSTVAFAPYE